ncbi:MAG: 16S rRNA (guanine(527)-N(7))-methyltransferase RsmG [Lachnospiraceae bacterium]
MGQTFENKLAKLDIILSEKQKEQFDVYYKLLIEWNQVMNLTGITEYQEVQEKHFIDSLSLVNAIDMSTINSLIDVGTGAGFPGIPLKIVFPELEVVLLDSLNKRVKFLDDIISKLQLKGITAIHGRAEDYAKEKKYRESFDLCVSRAVAHLATLTEYCIPYIKVGGFFVSYKAGEIDAEVSESKKAIGMLGGELTEIIKFTLPSSDIARSFIKIKKIKKTGKKYPRKSGLPAKEPLL